MLVQATWWDESIWPAKCINVCLCGWECFIITGSQCLVPLSVVSLTQAFYYRIPFRRELCVSSFVCLRVCVWCNTIILTRLFSLQSALSVHAYLPHCCLCSLPPLSNSSVAPSLHRSVSAATFSTSLSLIAMFSWHHRLNFICFSFFLSSSLYPIHYVQPLFSHSQITHKPFVTVMNLRRVKR